MERLKNVALIVLGLVIFALGIAPMVDGGGYPKGYGKNPCVTKAYDMAASQTVYSEAEYDWELNFIGCSHETFRRDTTNTCTVLAYAIARDWIRHGQPILNLTIDKVGRALDTRSIDKHGYKRYDCTASEDLSWYFDRMEG